MKARALFVVPRSIPIRYRGMKRSHPRRYKPENIWLTFHCISLLHAGADSLSSARFASFHEGPEMSAAKRLGVIALSILFVGQSGCLVLGAAAAGGGVVGVAYWAGKASRTVDSSLDDTSMAVGSAMRDLGVAIDDSHGTKTRAEIEGRLANGEHVHIDLDL